jgi:hypothetical protein
MTASELIPWFLVITAFLAFYIPRILAPHDVGLTADQIIGQGKDNQNVVSWYPVISCGYLVLIIGICTVLVFVTKLNPYPDGLTIIALFWGELECVKVCLRFILKLCQFQIVYNIVTSRSIATR